MELNLIFFTLPISNLNQMLETSEVRHDLILDVRHKNFVLGLQLLHSPRFDLDASLFLQAPDNEAGLINFSPSLITSHHWALGFCHDAQVDLHEWTVTFMSALVSRWRNTDDTSHLWQ